MQSCDFCNNSKIESRIVFQNGLIKVILSNAPIVPGHLLIIPNRHVQEASELTEKERSEIFEAFDILKSALKSRFGATGSNFAWNEGASAGQTIGHLHIHMLPRKEGDAGITQYEPRKFLYRPGSRGVASNAELERAAELLKKVIQKQ
jgi:diadenosine tetraphosphate (Ap4A) HIT family hydrolase